MSNMSTEEKSPLLYYEEKCEEKKKGHFEKHNRLRDISAGTTHVFTRFPDYVSSWWITTAFFVLLFFMMILLLLSTLTVGSLRIPRCVANDEMDNRSVHLVHTEDNWKPGEIEIIEKIVKTYTGYKIHLVLIQKMLKNEISKRNASASGSDASTTAAVTSTVSTTLSTQKSKIAKMKKIHERKKRKVHDFNTDAKKLLEMILHGKMWEKNFTDHAFAITTTTTTTPTSSTTTIPSTTTFSTIEDLLNNYPDAIIIEKTTYNKAFFNSPLYPYWKELNGALKIFAVRVLQLWQYGGISFDLNPTLGNHSDVIKTPIDAIYKRKILRFVLREKSNYESLSEKVVAADDEGLHMESRVPCHAFFGQILMVLREARPYSTVRSVIQDAVAVFCHYYSVEKKYCDKIEII